MRTPGHVVVSVAFLAHAGPPGVIGAVIAGAVLPDLPIIGLYLFEKARGTQTHVIWRERYQRRFWLTLIHGAHSIPLAVVGLAAGWALGNDATLGFFASALLHDLLDIPVHGMDAHRHFLPLSRWRFVSPLSYWDVAHHARAVTLLEWVIVAAASAFLWPGGGNLAHGALVAVNAGYALSMVRLFVAPEPSS